MFFFFFFFFWGGGGGGILLPKTEGEHHQGRKSFLYKEKKSPKTIKQKLNPKQKLEPKIELKRNVAIHTNRKFLSSSCNILKLSGNASCNTVRKIAWISLSVVLVRTLLLDKRINLSCVPH